MPLHHVIIGGGPAATNAIETIRQLETEHSKITLVSDEPAHSRMALPYWLSATIPREQTHTSDDANWQRLDVDARLISRASRIDPDTQQVLLNDGTSLTYDRLLLATGSSPVAPALPGIDLPGVQPMWTLANVDSALNTTRQFKRPRVVLVGAGFVGMIVLGTMSKRGWQLGIVERETQVLPQMLDGQAARTVQAWLADRSIDTHLSTSVESIEPTEDAKQIRLSNGSILRADLVVLSTGVRPNLDLTLNTAIETDHGVLVDQQMRTSVANVYAAGDVAQGPELLSDQRRVHAIQPTAVDHGRIAGANMAGYTASYPGSLSMNVLDVCGLQCVSYGAFDDTQTDTIQIVNPDHSIYRKLTWQDDRLVGAIFVGRASDAGMLTDVGMVKGIIQTQTPLGVWKKYLVDNPYDIRRPFTALGIAARLANTTLLGRPAVRREYRYECSQTDSPSRAFHQIFVDTKN